MVRALELDVSSLVIYVPVITFFIGLQLRDGFSCILVFVILIHFCD